MNQSMANGYLHYWTKPLLLTFWEGGKFYHYYEWALRPDVLIPFAMIYPDGMVTDLALTARGYGARRFSWEDMTNAIKHVSSIKTDLVEIKSHEHEIYSLLERAKARGNGPGSNYIRGRRRRANRGEDILQSLYVKGSGIVKYDDGF